MGNNSCRIYDRSATANGFSIQAVAPQTVLMLENLSIPAIERCDPPHDANTQTLPASTILGVRQTFSACPLPSSELPPTADASTNLAIRRAKRNNQFIIP